MDMLHKSFALSVKASDDAARTIQGYAATYGNIDLGGDMIQAGAFTDSLKVRMPKMLSQHDTTILPGIWTKAVDDANGLLVDGLFANTLVGNEHYELTKMGALDRLSIGYSVRDAEYATIDGQSVRILKTIDLWEVSIVTFPMNEQARIIGVKNKPTTERELEKCLRDVGLSHREAKAVIAGGFKAIADQRDVEGDQLQNLCSLFGQFKPLQPPN